MSSLTKRLSNHARPAMKNASRWSPSRRNSSATSFKPRLRRLSEETAGAVVEFEADELDEDDILRCKGLSVSNVDSQLKMRGKRAKKALQRGEHATQEHAVSSIQLRRLLSVRFERTLVGDKMDACFFGSSPQQRDGKTPR